MPAIRHSQSLADFRDRPAETFDRLRVTGEAEVLTVDGEVRAVLLSPAAYDALTREAQLSSDVTVIRRAIAEVDAGKGQEAGLFLSGLREELLAMKATRSKSADE